MPAYVCTIFSHYMYMFFLQNISNFYSPDHYHFPPFIVPHASCMGKSAIISGKLNFDHDRVHFPAGMQTTIFITIFLHYHFHVCLSSWIQRTFLLLSFTLIFCRTFVPRNITEQCPVHVYWLTQELTNVTACPFSVIKYTFFTNKNKNYYTRT